MQLIKGDLIEVKNGYIIYPLVRLSVNNNLLKRGMKTFKISLMLLFNLPHIAVKAVTIPIIWQIE